MLTAFSDATELIFQIEARVGPRTLLADSILVRGPPRV